MAEMICIFDSHGKKICYENHAAIAGPVLPPHHDVATGKYAIVYYDPANRERVVKATGEVRPGWTCLDKLQVLVNWVTSDPQSKNDFAAWSHILHRQPPH